MKYVSRFSFSFLPSCYNFRVTMRKRKRKQEGRSGTQERKGSEHTNNDKKEKERHWEKKNTKMSVSDKEKNREKKQRFEDQTKIKQGENIREERGTGQEEAPWHLRAKRTQGQRGHLPTRADLADAFLRRRNRPLLLRSDFACLLLVFDHHLRGFVSLFLWELLDFFFIR